MFALYASVRVPIVVCKIRKLAYRVIITVATFPRCGQMSIKAEATRLQAAGYCVMGVDLAFDPATGKKRPRFKTNWQHSRSDTCLQTMFTQDDNAMAIVTGDSSDVLAVDLDVPKPKDIEQGLGNALEVVKDLIDRHGLHPAVPIAITPSGGMHLLFKLSTSLSSGLQNASSGSKLGGLTMDVRSDRGCLLCYPSSVPFPDGAKQYKWDNPILPTSDLQPVPGWLLSLLNQRTSPSSTLTIDPPAKRQRKMEAESGDVLGATVQQQLNKMGTHLQIGMTWQRCGGIDFCMTDRTCACPLCGNVHASNNFRARILVDAAFILANYSTSCKPQAFGWEACNLIKQVIASPNTDDSFCGLLMACYRVQHRTIVYTAANRFLSFNGVVWETVHLQIVKQDIKTLIAGVITPLLCNIPKTEETIPKLKALASAKKYLEKAHNVSSIVQTFQTYGFDATIEDELDTNPDLLAVANGVVHLPSGKLEAGKGFHRLSIQLATKYVDTATPLIDDFFDSIFNEDRDLIAYMQRLLGYAITGHTREQIWVIWTGSGSNGKSLLLELVKNLLGQFCVMMPGELLFDMGKTTAGASTPHLQCLIKKRIGFKDEGRADKQNVLNEELIKTVTGSSSIATKPLYREFVEFQPRHLPILLCNRKPDVNINDAAMMRRIVVIPFHNKYTKPDALQDPYDATNPSHRLRDDGLQDKLMTQEGQEQLLAWLVRGAHQWYQTGLGTVPAAAAAAFNSYREENDHLTTFIRECCVIDAAASCNASQFLGALNAHAGIGMKQKDLRELMGKRGYKFMTTGRKYRGICLVDAEDN